MLDDSKQKLELIKIARELLREEYINKNNEQHQTWINECDELWKTQQVKLPYPSFVKFPSEDEVIAKALVLYNFISTSQHHTPILSAADTKSIDKFIKPALIVAEVVPVEKPFNNGEVIDV